MTTLRSILLLATLAGCTGVGAPPSQTDDRLDTYLGSYRGSFESALTEDPADDLNFNPCNPARQDCVTHHAPLADIVLTLQRGTGQSVRVELFRSLEDRAAGRPLDLLGAGCGTHLGDLRELQRHDGAGGLRWRAIIPLTAENRLCLGKLRPTSTHHLELELHRDPQSGERFARLIIDKKLTDANYLYVKEDGVERRVRIDPDNTVREDGVSRYRVCIENDLGEYERCVLTDREFKSFALPLPVPGGVAVNYTWWQQLTPRLRRTRGLYVLEQYSGRFDPVDDG